MFIFTNCCSLLRIVCGKLIRSNIEISDTATEENIEKIFKIGPEMKNPKIIKNGGAPYVLTVLLDLAKCLKNFSKQKLSHVDLYSFWFVWTRHIKPVSCILSGHIIIEACGPLFPILPTLFFFKIYV